MHPNLLSLHRACLTSIFRKCQSISCMCSKWFQRLCRHGDTQPLILQQSQFACSLFVVSVCKERWKCTELVVTWTETGATPHPEMKCVLPCVICTLHISLSVGTQCLAPFNSAYCNEVLCRVNYGVRHGVRHALVDVVQPAEVSDFCPRLALDIRSKTL